MSRLASRYLFDVVSTDSLEMCLLGSVISSNLRRAFVLVENTKRTFFFRVWKQGGVGDLPDESQWKLFTCSKYIVGKTPQGTQALDLKMVNTLHGVIKTVFKITPASRHVFFFTLEMCLLGSWLHQTCCILLWVLWNKKTFLYHLTDHLYILL
jgi:hypothetical protein